MSEMRIFSIPLQRYCFFLNCAKKWERKCEINEYYGDIVRKTVYQMGQ